MNMYLPRQLPLILPTSLAVVEAAEQSLGFYLPHLPKYTHRLVTGDLVPAMEFTELEGGFLKEDPDAQKNLGFHWLIIISQANHLIEPLQIWDTILYTTEISLMGRTWESPGKLIEICSWDVTNTHTLIVLKTIFPSCCFLPLVASLKLQRETFVKWIEDWLDGGLPL